jgi:hypothetical protein
VTRNRMPRKENTHVAPRAGRTGPSLQAEKLDLYKLCRKEYATPARPTLIDTTRAHYLAILGAGTPGGQEFTERIGALYAMAFTIKMTRKFGGLQDYVIGKLEAQYWTEDGVDPAAAPSELWHWRLLIRTPDCVEKAELRQAARKLVEKGQAVPVREVELALLDGGTCMQMLHVGPYEASCESRAQMPAMMERGGLEVSGRYHEVYLSDPHRVAPEKLRTILRLPVRKRRGG